MQLPRFLRLKAESDEMLRLDLMRFVASMGIVVMHVASMVQAGTLNLEPMLGGARIFVDIFFVISGLVIARFYSESTQSLSGYGDFMRRRFARLLPLHWATLGFYLALFALSTMTGAALNSAERYDFSCLAPNLLLIHAFDVCKGRSFNIVSWSISAEVAMYAIFPLIVLVSRSFRSALWLVALALAAAMVAFDPLWSDRTFDWGVARALPSFLFGMGLFAINPALRRLAVPSALFAPVGLLLIACILLQAPPGLLLAIGYAWVAIAYMGDLRTPAGWAARTFGPLGQLTYSLYMLHPIVQTVFIAMVGQRILHLSGAALNVWIAVVVLAILPVIACFSLYYFETPMRRLLSGKRKPKRAPDGAPARA